MEELQLQDLKNMEAVGPSQSNWSKVGRLGSLPAVEVKQKANPAKHDVAMVPRPPASGKLSRRPIVGNSEDDERRQVTLVAVLESVCPKFRRPQAMSPYFFLFRIPSP
jgi:hypothetical protein